MQPWQAAWRTFRASQRQRGGQADADGDADGSSARAEAGPGKATTAGDAAAGAGGSGAQTAEGVVAAWQQAAEAEKRASGDAIFAWGCLDWLSTQGRAADKKSDRSAWVVAAPDLLQVWATSETPPRHLRDTSEAPPRHLQSTSKAPLKRL